MPQDATLHVKLDRDTDARLKQLALARGTSKGQLVRDAISACYQASLDELPVHQAHALAAYQGGYISLGKLARAMGMHVLQARTWLQERGLLAGGVAHDFNNMLTVINGYARALIGKLPAGDRLHDQAAQILRAGERSAALVRQLLAFSRRQVLQPEVLDLNTVVADLENMLQRLIGEDVELVHAPAPEPCPVRADPGTRAPSTWSSPTSSCPT